MDRTSGAIIRMALLTSTQRVSGKYMPMEIPPKQKQLVRGRVGRNDPCPCGSGRKFKKCCLLRRK